jgi:hypothetical protein
VIVRPRRRSAGPGRRRTPHRRSDTANAATAASAPGRRSSAPRPRRPAAGACSASSRPRPLQHAPPVTEVLPGQRVRAQRHGRGVVSAGRHRAACARSPPAPGVSGQRYDLRSILSHGITFRSGRALTTCVVKSVGAEVAGGQRRGRWTGVPLEDRQADGATSCWQPGCNSSAPRPARRSPSAPCARPA